MATVYTAAKVEKALVTSALEDAGQFYPIVVDRRDGGRSNNLEGSH